jgi:hypothetical protein
MTDLETLLQMRGIRYERARIEARSEEIATRFFLSQKERTNFMEVRGETDLEVLRGLQGYQVKTAVSVFVAIFAVLLVTVAIGFVFAVL